MKKASWWVALLVGVVIGGTGVRMIRGPAPTRRGPAQRPPSAAPPQQVEDPHAVYRVPVEDSPVRGPADALVTIAVVSDFQCPFCKRVEPTLRQVMEAFPGKVRLVWKHQPLPFHAHAIPAAVVAEEARAEGGDAAFWAMHDKLFEIAPALDRPQLEAAARQLGLDAARVGAALDKGAHVDRIRRDQALCTRLGANGTPTMFVNGRKVVGAVPFEQLRAVVEEELRKAEALVASGVAPRDVYAKLQERGATSTVYLPGAAAPRPAAQGNEGPPPLPATSAARVPLRKDDPVRGPADAKVTIAVFSDFQCPFCARLQPTLRQIEQAFPGAVRISWKHLPLPPTMHPQARPAAEAAEAAREQGKFWEMHDRLFAAQRSLSPELYRATARELGLDAARFDAALASHAGAVRIDEDLRLAASVAANATPTLFVNCRRVEGAYPFESLKPLIEEELRKADALARSGRPAAELYEAACAENLRLFGGGAPAAAVPAAAAPSPAAAAGGADAVPIRRDDPVRGRAGAPLTVVLFSDFQCPYCARAEPSVRAVEAAYPADVRVVWKHLPLPMHPNAMPAALAAEAARVQGGGVKFWAMHDRLFSNQGALSEATYERYARELGLDLTRFRRDMADPALRARVEEDARLAQRLGVNGTPTFLVNGERVVGADGLRATVDRLVAQARQAR